jgi:hypothetical protein
MRHVEELHKGWIAYASIRDDGVHFALTEANARAEALIYLLENKLLPTKNILCDEHATTNCNSYVPLRPRKNGRLGAEPDNSHLLRAAWGRAALFLLLGPRLNCLAASIVSANFLLDASLASARSRLSDRLSLLSLDAFASLTHLLLPVIILSLLHEGSAVLREQLAVALFPMLDMPLVTRSVAAEAARPAR